MAPRNVVRLVDVQAARRDRIRDRLAEAVARLVLGWTGFYVAEDVAALVTALARLIEAAQQRTASATDAYLASVIGELRGSPAAPVGVRVDPDRLRQATTHRDALERVAAEYRRHLANGLDDNEAKGRAAERAKLLADDDLALSAREAARQVFTRTNGISGYRRVIRPELSKGGTCGLCVAASDRLYGRGDLLPIHARCNCTVLPVLGAVDPGKGLNDDELAELYRRAGGAARNKLARARYTTHEHGELGPVLREPGEHFRDPGDVSADEAA